MLKRAYQSPELLEIIIKKQELVDLMKMMIESIEAREHDNRGMSERGS